jgi:hypothetical protein
LTKTIASRGIAGNYDLNLAETFFFLRSFPTLFRPEVVATTSRRRKHPNMKTTIHLITIILSVRNSLGRPSRTGLVCGALALASFALAPQARAVCLEGCDLTNSSTFLGDNALINNTTGDSNTATGANALASNTIGEFNTASGANALFSNTTGSYNTATGDLALKNNTIGHGNAANGASALVSNTAGCNNTANGVSALLSNNTGIGNTAAGFNALACNTTGNDNTTTGFWGAL